MGRGRGLGRPRLPRLLRGRRPPYRALTRRRLAPSRRTPPRCAGRARLRRPRPRRRTRRPCARDVRGTRDPSGPGPPRFSPGSPARNRRERGGNARRGGRRTALDPAATAWQQPDHRGYRGGGAWERPRRARSRRKWPRNCNRSVTSLCRFYCAGPHFSAFLAKIRASLSYERCLNKAQTWRL